MSESHGEYGVEPSVGRNGQHATHHTPAGMKGQKLTLPEHLRRQEDGAF
jgi:hypothetical protein